MRLLWGATTPALFQIFSWRIYSGLRTVFLRADDRVRTGDLGVGNAVLSPTELRLLSPRSPGIYQDSLPLRARTATRGTTAQDFRSRGGHSVRNAQLRSSA